MILRVKGELLENAFMIVSQATETVTVFQLAQKVKLIGKV